jgi:microcompartment protein CcmK/EutM
MGIVRGRVVLSLADPALAGTRFLIVEVVTPERLAGGTPPAVRSLVVADRLNPAPGQMIGFVEGREAANPYGPRGAPVDATCSLIVDQVNYRRAATRATE